VDDADFINGPMIHIYVKIHLFKTEPVRDVIRARGGGNGCDVIIMCRLRQASLLGGGTPGCLGHFYFKVVELLILGIVFIGLDLIEIDPSPPTIKGILQPDQSRHTRRQIINIPPPLVFPLLFFRFHTYMRLPLNAGLQSA